MKKIIVNLLLLFMCSAAAMAQKATVTATIVDGTLNEPLPGAAVVLLTEKDSTQVTGVVSNVEGLVNMPVSKYGTYLLRISYMGYVTQWKTVTLDKKNKMLDLGTVVLQEDAKVMKEAQVTAQLAQVEMKEDTFVYNAGAYRLPEGSALEELVKKLPGAEVDEDGTIKINGKTVSKIMVGGKEFFNNDTKMAMKNIPTKMVEKIKSYDKKSDYSRITGIDDGEEETVLDLTVKKGMKEGWLINADLGYGTHDRYTAKLNLSRYTDHMQFTLLGSQNNINDNSFPGGGGRGWWGGSGQGITTSGMYGLNFVWDNGKKEDEAGYLELGGNLRYNQRKNDVQTRTNSEMFLDETRSTFSNSENNAINKSKNLNGNLRFEWQPDSMTNLMFRPNFSRTWTNNHGNNFSATFNEDPYDYFDNPLKLYKVGDQSVREYNLAENQTVRDRIAVNDNTRQTKNKGNSANFDADAQLNRRLGKAGRNFTLNAGGRYSHSDNTSWSRSLINYYQQKDDTDPAKYKTTFTNQYNLSPSTSYNVQGQLSYTEPITKNLNLQARYQFQYRYSDNDRSMYSIDSLLTKFGGYYTAEQLYLGYLPGLDSLNYCYNAENSQYATYREYNHDASLMARYTRTFENGQNVRLNAGVNFQPQTTHMDYQKSHIDTTVVRHTFNWAPRVDMRWKISNTSQLRLRYNARMSQPSMTNLLEVVDSSDPLNISTGNAGLRSSWANNFFAFYNGYNVDKQRGWMINARYNNTKNSISTATIYDTNTGARYTRPMNIDGNWDLGTSIMFNTALDTDKHFNLMNFANVSYNNHVGYLSSNSDGSTWGDIYRDGSTTVVDMDKVFSQVALQKTTTKNTNLSDNLRLNYRNDFGDEGTYEIGLNSGFNYQHARNELQANANIDSWTFSYGGNLNITFPWQMSLATDISQQSRRGYADESMNTNELIWNAQLSQNLKKWLKGQDLSISVQWYDILRKRSNISRNISATMRSDTWTNAINSYVMVHVIYTLNLLGGKEARANGFGGPGGWGGPGGGNRGGGPGGRGGGGRPF
ncbi:MAG: TonB-dependent receptor [Bacteroidaceae bacterium]|nr:TonB-dependent receptor [Bacteroidaceae bacterium]